MPVVSCEHVELTKMIDIFLGHSLLIIYKRRKEKDQYIGPISVQSFLLATIHSHTHTQTNIH